MCICFWWHSAAADCPIKLVLLFNRDEVLSRPAKPGKVDLRGPNYAPPVAYYGKDLTGGGTWLAVQEDGRFAAVLNNSAHSADAGALKLLGIYALIAAVLYPVLPHVVLYVFLLPIYWYFATQITQPPSRGKLPLEFILGDRADPKDFIENHLAKKMHRYNGFNMVLGNLKTSCFTTNASSSKTKDDNNAAPIVELQPGEVHGVSNGPFGSWWKVERGKQKTAEVIREFTEQKKDIDDKAFEEMLFRLGAVMEDATPCDCKPSCEYPAKCSSEKQTSSIFVPVFREFHVTYGTRTTTVVVVRREGERLIAHVLDWDLDVQTGKRINRYHQLPLVTQPAPAPAPAADSDASS